ncbi:sigma-70 family RNA polymerase sigma factor [Nocardia panacis]|uniref:Sigma-70 family RNA polymerase sigma factor n=1 Tax=Nocardia panacis TaxID=2340916 RepID=A0A3A4JL31_9NOCA|nr:RNA polymerase sigma factor SigJ [Nocardia panacis]RJO69315.1 sigma-70 family RNA polymerase sigma factor [Nocardia panacis]
MTADPFLDNRRLLFATAYRMLGTVTDVEDVLQDAWLTWHRTERTEVRNPVAYLVRTVTNLALNRLTSAQATRESYIGPWLPEPLVTTPDLDPDLAESVSQAMLVVLETLSPVERAVFLLREVFGYSHAEIADALDRPEPTIRQIAHRARARVRARRPRFDADRDARAQVTEMFMAAAAGGNLNALMDLLAPEVTAWTDGGGVVTAARRPLHGPDHVARWIVGVLAKPIVAGFTMEPAVLNGELGVIIRLGGVAVSTFDFDLEHGKIRDLRFQANPNKLAGLAMNPL